MQFKKLAWENSRGDSVKITSSSNIGYNYYIDLDSFELNTRKTGTHSKDVFVKYSSLEEAKAAAQKHHDEWVRKTFFVTCDDVNSEKLKRWLYENGFFINDIAQSPWVIIRDEGSSVIGCFFYDKIGAEKTINDRTVERCADEVNKDLEDVIQEIERIEL